MQFAFVPGIAHEMQLIVTSQDGMIRQKQENQAAVPALGKIHPFILKGDLGNAEGVHDSNPEAFISLGPLWTSQGTRKAQCRCLLLVRGAKC